MSHSLGLPLPPACLLSPGLNSANERPPALNRFRAVIPLIPCYLRWAFLKSFLRPYVCRAYFKRKLEPVAISLCGIQLQLVTHGHIQSGKISTSCGDNKTQLITYNVTRSLLCFQGVCVGEHGNERLRRTPWHWPRPVSAKCIHPVPSLSLQKKERSVKQCDFVMKITVDRVSELKLEHLLVT